MEEVEDSLEVSDKDMYTGSRYSPTTSTNCVQRKKITKNGLLTW